MVLTKQTNIHKKKKRKCVKKQCRKMHNASKFSGSHLFANIFWCKILFSTCLMICVKWRRQNWLFPKKWCKWHLCAFGPFSLLSHTILHSDNNESQSGIFYNHPPQYIMYLFHRDLQLPVWSELSNNNNTNKNTANFSEFQVYCFPLSGARQYLH